MKVLKTKKKGKTDSPEYSGYKRQPDEIALTIVSKPRIGQFHEKRRLEAPEMATKPLLSVQKNDQLV